MSYFFSKRANYLFTIPLLVITNSIYCQNKMKKEEIDKTGTSYSQSVKISDYSELLFISGQIPLDEKDQLPNPNSFEEQCRYAWSNIRKQLQKSNMDFENLVKVTIFLSDKKYRKINSQVRQKVLKGLSPALTIIITGIYDENWLLEIEAIAAK